MAQSILSAPHFQNEAAAFAYVEAKLWPNGPHCPFCGATEEHVGRLQGKTTRLGLHKCYACKKPFTVRMGTIFESSHLALHLWLQAVHLMCASKKGVSTRQIQRMLQCSMKTAWFLTHRIREAMKTGDLGPLGGEDFIIEADDTGIGHNPTKKLRRSARERQIVFALVERDGAVRSFHVPNIKASTLGAILGKHASTKSHFMSDEATTYANMGWNFASHGVVKHSADEYVRYPGLLDFPATGPVAHTNTVEGYFSILKRGVYGVYHHVSPAHLHRYLAEFDFRYSNREKVGINDVARADRALAGFKGRRLTYETTRSGG